MGRVGTGGERKVGRVCAGGDEKSERYLESTSAQLHRAWPEQGDSRREPRLYHDGCYRCYAYCRRRLSHCEDFITKKSEVVKFQTIFIEVHFVSNRFSGQNITSDRICGCAVVVFRNICREEGASPVSRYEGKAHHVLLF